MKLSAVYFDDLVPIPGTSERQQTFAAEDGWDVERVAFDAFRIRGERRRDGGIVVHDFMAEGFGATYAMPVEPAVAPVVELPASDPAPSPKRRRA